jgi:basic membrane protein A
MKQLQNVTETILQAAHDGTWATYGGKVSNFSLAEGEYVGLPTAEGSWRLSTFTVEEYEAVKAAIIAGTVAISADTENAPAVAETTTVNYIG